MPYRPQRVGESSIRESARIHAENGDAKAKRWLEQSKTHRKRMRAASRASVKARVDAEMRASRR